MKKILLLLSIVMTSVAAIAETFAASSAQAAASSQGAKPTLVAGATAESKPVKSGKVLEVIDSPMYTYLKVTRDKGAVWLAAYKTDITRGSTVKYSGGVEMPNFYSKSLNRTFDLIVFVDSLELVME